MHKIGLCFIAFLNDQICGGTSSSSLVSSSPVSGLFRFIGCLCAQSNQPTAQGRLARATFPIPPRKFIVLRHKERKQTQSSLALEKLCLAEK